MNKVTLESITLPSLKGQIGNWTYYSCLMSMREIGTRVNYSFELKEEKSLSDRIQRELEKGRDKAIARYIKEKEDRFFNSIVMAIQSPQWVSLELDIDTHIMKSIGNNVATIIGTIELSGQESLFTIDGQHRLSGIKKLLAEEKSNNVSHSELDELIPVIFVDYGNTELDHIRSRRLFTTLNKTAKPVNKKDIIAFDEDDVMAITTRYLIGKENIFHGERIDIVGSANIQATNNKSLTTIINLYDILSILFSASHFSLKEGLLNLKNNRPEQATLDEYFDYAEKFFRGLKNNFIEISEFLSAGENTAPIVEKHRNPNGGSVLFRPMGLKVFTRIISLLTKEMSLDDSIKLVAKLPTDITNTPYKDLIWDSNTKNIIPNGVLLREVLLDMLGGRSKHSNDQAKFLQYCKDRTGDKILKLPKRVVQEKQLKMFN